MSFIKQLIHVFNPDGSHAGSAAFMAEVVGGKIFDLDPRPVAADDAGALSELIPASLTAALAAVDAHVATIAERDATITTLTAERDAARSRVSELEAQLATINGSPDENGVPLSVTMASARIALSRAGKLSAVTAALNAIPGQPGEEARAWWEYSSRVERNHPTVQAMTPIVGTSADVDALFVAAAAIAG